MGAMAGYMFRLVALALLLLPASVARAQTDALTAGEVLQIIGQAEAEATARGAPAVIAVVDRVGNVLAVSSMPGAAGTIAIGSQRIPGAGLNRLENVPAGIIPTTLGAIAKAVTGAYLSSSGNAFTTRTASQIVQEFFNVGERGQPGGPLFGVQFSSLPCSDLVISDPALTIGPKRTPLGLSADPGGFPLYKGNFVVGGIGVISDGQYGLDLNIQDFDRSNDELIAIAGQSGFAPTIDITAQRIAVDGKTLRYSDVSARHLATNPANAAPSAANLVAVAGYKPAAGATAGTNYGEPGGSSGYRADTAGLFPGLAPTPFILVTPGNVNRFTPKAGAAGLTAAGAASVQSLTGPEVQQVLASALGVAYTGRAQIRKPLGSFIQVTISVVDATGDILGVARTPDGPLFGTDVSLQKARSAAFFSNPLAAADLNAVPARNVGGLIPVPALSTYVTAIQNFLGPTTLANGIAFGARSIGNVHRPFFPDGAAFGIPGPLSNAYATWSPFNVGLQLDLVIENIVLNALGGSPPAAAPFCTPLAPQPFGGTRLANGAQIFAGGVPIFKNGDLVGAIGVSGDGIDQDDMISFLGVHRAGLILGSGVGNAPVGQRANTLKAFDRSLRYVSCPFAPFLGSKEQAPCDGK